MPESLAILIDCWDVKDYTSSKNLQLYDRTISSIIKFCDEQQNISTLLLASYNCVFSEYDSDSLWYSNRRKIISQKHFETHRPELIAAIEKQWHYDPNYFREAYNAFKGSKWPDQPNEFNLLEEHIKDEFIDMWASSFPHAKQKNANRLTHPEILSYKNDSKFMMVSHSVWELDYYLLSFNKKNINNIYVLGFDWENCVFKRPLGLLSLAKAFPDINLYVSTACTLQKNLYKNYVVPNLDSDSNYTKISDTIFKVNY